MRVDRSERVGRHTDGARARASQRYRDSDERGEQERSPGGDQHAAAPACGDRGLPLSGIAGRRLQRRVLGQDGSFELLQLAAGLEAKLLDQPTPRDAIALQRVGLAPRSVQREHQLSDEPLAHGMLVHEPFQLPDQPPVLAQRKLRVDPLLQSGQP